MNHSSHSMLTTGAAAIVKQYKLIIAYDGTDYYGWQVQPNKSTIVHVMQDTFKKIFGSEITLEGASRTDAGVHALGQVATFTTDCSASAESILFAWNNVLAPTIRIVELSEIPMNFHPRKMRQRKTYWYHLFVDQPLPFWTRYGWHVGNKLCLDRLQEALQLFVGTHDFRAFCAEPASRNTIKTIEQIVVHFIDDWHAYRIEITGSGFLRHMIRRIVGASVMVALKPHISVESLQIVLKKCDPNHAFTKAPAHGLLLYTIEYLNRGVSHS